MLNISRSSLCHLSGPLRYRSDQNGLIRLTKGTVKVQV